MEWLIIAALAAWVAAAPDPVSAGIRGGIGGAARSGSTAAAGSMRSGWASGRRVRSRKRKARWARWQQGRVGSAAVWVERGLRGLGRGAGSALAAGGRAAVEGGRSGWSTGRAGYRPIPDRVRSGVDRVKGRVDPDGAPQADEAPDQSAPGDPQEPHTEPLPVVDQGASVTGRTETGMANDAAATDVEVESYEDLERELAEVERGWEDDGEPLMEAARALMESWADHYDGAVEAVERGRALHDAASDGEEFVPGQTVLDALEALKEAMDEVAPLIEAVNEAAEPMDVVAVTPDEVSDAITEAVTVARDEHEDVEDTAVRTGAKVRLDKVAS